MPGSDLSRETYGFACWTGPAQAMRTAHAHDEVELNLSLSGPLDYLIGGRLRSLPAGRLGLFWASTPHQLVDAPPGARLIWMTIPLTRFLSWKPPQQLLGLLFANEIAAASATDVELDRATMLRWVDEIDRSADHAAVVALEAQAAVQRLALSLRRNDRADPAGPDRDHGGPPRFAGTPVAIMAGFISRRFAEPIGVAEVAAAAHLSPQHAMELFHRSVGLTIGGYLHQCRIAEAQRLLLTTDATVTAVATSAGFGSLSRFHAAFKAATGTTPARYRRAESVRAP
ncbi:MAG TPA: helix-turn-helix domain-containing protein [Microlunatus sp.]|nr:helix-turn-helix domain-containing protein [Microlunatus sp.]